MADNLVIVESPAKAKTIEKFLGKDYKVASSFGHIVDLPSSELGVDVNATFMPKYIVSQDKKKVVNELKKLTRNAQTVWLASDEDREGEAIAWHLSENLDLNESNSKRIVFSEITKSAILKAIENPRKINQNLVNAQQARRVLDRLVGYELSPILWTKVKGGISAGRVQSVAVRLIVEREKEIQVFQPQQAFKVQGVFITKQNKAIHAQLAKSFESADDTRKFLDQCKACAYQVAAVKIKPAKKSPAAPFTTSTLQQEASRKLGFSVRRTMNVAQRLYESGLITYMRTDSVNLSKEAQAKFIAEIEKRFGGQYAKKRNYKTKNKGAQEAHEAIRPTNPERATIAVENDQRRLYELIWKRTTASQMSDAQLERTQIDIVANNHKEVFQAKGEVVTFDGFLKLYLEGVDDANEEVQGLLPKVKEGAHLTYQSITATQRFSRPPYRFSEASLVKKLEELGIGRPSTYAPTISTVQQRGYVEKGQSEGLQRSYLQLHLEADKVKEAMLTENVGSDKGKLIPTDIGVVVNDFLVGNFESIMDYNFTAQVEQNFDDIANGLKDWTETLKGFYTDFHLTVNEVKTHAKRVSGERVLGTDPESGRTVKVRLGKYGPMAQIGEPDDEEKPLYASLTKEQQLATVSFEEVLKLFELPKTLGEHNGELIIVNNGRYGPYIKYGEKFISIPKEILPGDLIVEDAIVLIEEKLKADAPIYEHNNLPVTKGVGRFGPYLKWSGMFINVNKKYDFENLSDEDIVELIEEKIQKEKDKVIHDWTEAGIRVEKARWGRSNIIKGKQKVELSKDIDPKKITLKKAQDYLDAQKPAKKPKKSKSKK